MANPSQSPESTGLIEDTEHSAHSHNYLVTNLHQWPDRCYFVALAVQKVADTGPSDGLRTFYSPVQFS